ncbi:MAG: hypothetical protein IBX50_01210 [Marinospirillum sp.]|uniref:hypothetical protein n=1 Tax=Marinospirillum sp. TaxID=2183934 RepID=UPI0019FF50CC|nr:hypothetical protein [Marinospirillum sp.]MBE0505321.1 hypothetical protein [Marinospirillum sp.]
MKLSEPLITVKQRILQAELSPIALVKVSFIGEACWENIQNKGLLGTPNFRAF